MCDEETKKYLAELAYYQQTAQYEAGGIFTIGGNAGNYMLKSPFNTECEYKVVAISSSGSAAPFALTVGNPSQLFMALTATSLGLQSQGTENSNPLEGIAGVVGNGGVITTQEWIPLGKGVVIYFSINPAANQVIMANIAFRRSLYRLIPETPRLSPATHTHPQSRRELRMLHSLSAEMSGFEQQYPTRQGSYGEDYTHEIIPETQDTMSGGGTGYRGRAKRYGR